MFTKSHLISFGNYLLKNYGVPVYSNDGKNIPIQQREVSHADMENWKHSHQDDGPIYASGAFKFKPREKHAQPSNNPLPSRFTFGDPVVVYFGTGGIIQNCSVIKIHFTESKVFYDVEVKWKHLESADNYSAGVDTERELTDRLYNLDSGVVFSPNDFEQ